MSLDRLRIHVEDDLGSSISIASLLETIEDIKKKHNIPEHEEFNIYSCGEYNTYLELNYCRLESDEEYTKRQLQEERDKAAAIKRIQKKQELENNLLAVANDLEKIEYLRLKKKYEKT